MKVLGKIMKILAALAAVAGVIYVIATYGDKIVAWAKSLLERFRCSCDCECITDDCEDCECECDSCYDCACEEAIQEQEAAAEAVDVPAQEAVQAEESDFQG